MSKLEELLQGVDVEWLTLDDIARFRRGSFPQPYGNSEWYDGEESMPFVQVNDVGFNMKLVEKTKNRISKKAQPKSIFVPENTVIVTLQGSIGRVAITQYDSYVDRTLAIFEEYKKEIDLKYFAYQLEAKFNVEKDKARGNIIKTITKDDFKKFEIPIPCPDNPEKSLEIQQEIVRVLDELTSLTNQLTTELETERQNRKKQFEFFREQLFTFEEGSIIFNKLGEIGEFQRGKRFVKTDMISEGVPCIHYGEMYTHYGIWAREAKSFLSAELVSSKKLRVAEKNDVVIVAAGETIEDIGKGTAWLGEEGVVIHDACFSYTSPLNPSYVAYFTRTKQFHDQIRRNISSGKISAINSKGLEKVYIPIPSLAEQERIVKLLDQFDSTHTAIEEEITKEIKLRTQQYEYYREKLLSFPQN